MFKRRVLQVDQLLDIVEDGVAEEHPLLSGVSLLPNTRFLILLAPHDGLQLSLKSLSNLNLLQLSWLKHGPRLPKSSLESTQWLLQRLNLLILRNWRYLLFSRWGWHWWRGHDIHGLSSRRWHLNRRRPHGIALDHMLRNLGCRKLLLDVSNNLVVVE
jgi:hypothetical protein